MGRPLRQLIVHILFVGGVWGALGCSSGAGRSSPSSVVKTYTPPASQPSVTGLPALQAMEVVDAFVDPPLGWHPDPHPSDAKHAHIAWVSPSGETAYGVVLINLPWPVGPDLVLWGFLNNLRASDHQGDLISKTPAPDLPGLRFVAESGQYIIRVNLIVRGWRAWAIYAGTLKSKPVNAQQLDLAQQARDNTQVGLPDPTASAH